MFIESECDELPEVEPAEEIVELEEDRDEDDEEGLEFVETKTFSNLEERKEYWRLEREKYYRIRIEPAHMYCTNIRYISI